MVNLMALEDLMVHLMVDLMAYLMVECTGRWIYA